MTGQAMWAFVIVAVVAAALIGFLLGRANGNGAKQRLKELEEDLGNKDRELAGYKREVDAHFDRTASLFVSMAGSYKALFEHLSEGYAKLSDGSDRDLFRERVATLLLDGPQREEARAEDGWRDEAADEAAGAAQREPDADDVARDEAEAAQPQADADEDARGAADAQAEPDEAVRVSPAEAHGPTGNGQEPPAVEDTSAAADTPEEVKRDEAGQEREAAGEERPDATASTEAAQDEAQRKS